MGKILILLIIIVAVLYLVRKAGAGRPSANRPTGREQAERMVNCVQCGVYLPVSEALMERGRYYCCEKHRRAAAR
jgi:uncharacterized protein